MTAADPFAGATHELPPAPTIVSSNPLTRARIERLAAGTIAGFSLVFAAQVLPVLVQQTASVWAPWNILVPVVLLAALLWLAIAAAIGRTVPAAASAVCVIYLVALATWPVRVVDPSAYSDTRPWLWYLLTVATACAVLAFPLVPAAIYTVLMPVLYAVVVSTVVGRSGAETQWLDCVYAVSLGSVLLVIVTMLRQAAQAVDASQIGALARYEGAVRAHANEAERVEVDAIVHDSVLTTLLAASNARTPDAMALAVVMAEDAIHHLSAPDRSRPRADAVSNVTLGRVRDRIVDASRSFAASFAISPAIETDVAVPLAAAEALYSAAVQAMVNSAQHAGGLQVHRRLTIASFGGGGAVGGGGGTGTEGDGESPGAAAFRSSVEIVIEDDGSGFDPACVPAERLGLQVSIRERVARVGGKSEIRSTPGRGTRVVLRWPAPTPRHAHAAADPMDLPGDSGLDGPR